MLGEDGEVLPAVEGLTGSGVMPSEGGDVVAVDEEKPKDMVKEYKMQ